MILNPYNSIANLFYIAHAMAYKKNGYTFFFEIINSIYAFLLKTYIPNCQDFIYYEYIWIYLRNN